MLQYLHGQCGISINVSHFHLGLTEWKAYLDDTDEPESECKPPNIKSQLSTSTSPEFSIGALTRYNVGGCWNSLPADVFRYRLCTLFSRRFIVIRQIRLVKQSQRPLFVDVGRSDRERYRVDRDVLARSATTKESGIRNVNLGTNHHDDV